MIPRSIQPPATGTAALLAMEYQLPRHFLHSGDLFCARDPHVVTTVLGSCVAVCLHDPATGIGGMNHFVLPFVQENTAPSLRHGDPAITGLLDRLAALGARRDTLQAKIFGGGAVIGQRTGSGRGLLDIGRRNVEVCRSVLERHRIPILRERVRETSGLTIKMLTSTGEVWVRRIAAPPQGAAVSGLSPPPGQTDP